MNFKQAIKIFEERFPKIKVLKCIDYDNNHYILEAVENPDIVDYNLPYYAIDKVSGKITSFIPTFDLDSFFNAVENRTLYSTY